MATVIYIHANTTGFSANDQIIELGALSDHSTFHKVITPTVTIHPKASEVSNLYLLGGRLYYKCWEIETQCENRQQAFIELIHYIARHTNPVLLSHSMQFFKRFFMTEVHRLGLDEYYSSAFAGRLRYADSLKILRDVLPHLLDHQLRTVAQNVLHPHKFEECMRYFCIAFNKAYVLKNIMQQLSISPDTILRYS